MLFKNLLFTLAACCSLNLVAQTSNSGNRTQIKWGKEHETLERLAPASIIGISNGELFSWEADFGMLHSTKRFIRRYDKNLNPVLETKIELKDSKEDRDFEDVVMTKKGDIYLLSSYANKTQKKNFLFCQKVDKKTLLARGELRKIADVATDTKGFSLFRMMTANKDEGSFSTIPSSDSSKLLVVALAPFDKGDPEKFDLTVLNEDMQVVWDKSITMPYNDELWEFSSYRLDNDGDVYVVGKLYKDRVKDRKNGKPNYKYQMLRFTAGSTKPEIIDIALDKKFITDLKVTLLDNGDYVCAGFYSNEGTGSIGGVYYMTVDGKTNTPIMRSTKDFSLDFLTEGMTDRQKKRAERRAKNGDAPELNQIKFREIIRRDDGGCVLIGEQYYIIVSQYTDSQGRTRTTYTYYHDDVIVTSISPKGDIEWSSKVPKNQHSSGRPGIFNSYVSVVAGNKIHIIFNDDIDNIKKDRFSKGARLDDFTGEKNSAVQMVSFDANGKHTEKTLLKNEDAEIVVVPNASVQTTSREMILLGKRKGNQKYARMTFLD
jgi:hypothetical protein